MLLTFKSENGSKDRHTGEGWGLYADVSVEGQLDNTLFMMADTYT